MLGANLVCSHIRNNRSAVYETKTKIQLTNRQKNSCLRYKNLKLLYSVKGLHVHILGVFFILHFSKFLCSHLPFQRISLARGTYFLKPIFR